MWYKNKVDASPGETIYEIITKEDGLSFGLAIADIMQSEAHRHDSITEIYSVLEGEIELAVNGHTKILVCGDSDTIRPGTIHSARSLTDQQARVSVISIPPWNPGDHHLVKQ